MNKARGRARDDETLDLAARLAAAETALAHEIRRSQTLSRIAEAIGDGGDFDALVQAVVDGGVDLTGATFGAFYQTEAGGRRLALHSVAGAPREAFAAHAPAGGGEGFAPIFEREAVVRSDDVTLDPRLGHAGPVLAVRSYLAAPVVTRAGESLGVLAFGHPLAGRFDDRAESLLVGLAAQAAAAVEGLRAHQAALRVLERRRDEDERLKFALESGRLGSWELDVETWAYEASDICKTNYGRDPGEAFSFSELVAAIHPEDRARMMTAIQDASRHGSDYDIEYRVLVADGETRWVHARGRAAQTADHGGARRMAGVSLDVTDRKRAEERQRLLLNELNHRVKNTLVSVQSIARQTLRATASPELFRDAFEARLMALSQAHNLLTQQNWEGASLREVFDAEFEAFAGRERMVFDYARDVRLSPKSTVAIGMAVHELATNALKYGALSVPEGTVRVTWSVEPGGTLRLVWSEHGGPPVTPPTRRGFGARLLEKGLAGELSGDVSLTYANLGLVCSMGLPMRALEP